MGDASQVGTKRDRDEGAIASATNKKSKQSPMLSAIIQAIRSHKLPQGSSAMKICNDLKDTFPNDKLVKKTLKKAVENGELVQNKASYLVAGDPLYEDTSEKVTIEEVSAGSGRGVVKGDSVVIAYIGTLHDNGHEFDRGSTFAFQVGAGDVVKGMDAGVLGMQVGGRRKVTIPSTLGYGKRGSAPDIPPNATLVFDITLKTVK